jgi:hypothetical protein
MRPEEVTADKLAVLYKAAMEQTDALRAAEERIRELIKVYGLAHLALSPDKVKQSIREGVKDVAALEVTGMTAKLEEMLRVALGEVPKAAYDLAQARKEFEKVRDSLTVRWMLRWLVAPWPVLIVAGGLTVWWINRTADDVRALEARKTLIEAQLADQSSGTVLRGVGAQAYDVNGAAWIRIDGLRYRLERNGNSRYLVIQARDQR